jgi:hypothetical protein
MPAAVNSMGWALKCSLLRAVSLEGEATEPISARRRLERSKYGRRQFPTLRLP